MRTLILRTPETKSTRFVFAKPKNFFFFFFFSFLFSFCFSIFRRHLFVVCGVMGRKGFLSSKIGDLRKNEDEKKIVSQPTRNHQQKNELKAAFRDVIAVGASALEGKNKKFTKDLMLQQSGRLQKKNLKMPYKMLLSVQKKRKERETREREEMRKVGMDVDKKKAKKKVFFLIFLFCFLILISQTKSFREPLRIEEKEEGRTNNNNTLMGFQASSTKECFVFQNQTSHR